MLSARDEKGSTVQIRHGPATVKEELVLQSTTDQIRLGRYVLMMILESGDLPVSTTLCDLREIGRC